MGAQEERFVVFVRLQIPGAPVGLEEEELDLVLLRKSFRQIVEKRLGPGLMRRSLV